MPGPEPEAVAVAVADDVNRVEPRAAAKQFGDLPESVRTGRQDDDVESSVAGLANQVAEEKLGVGDTGINDHQFAAKSGRAGRGPVLAAGHRESRSAGTGEQCFRGSHAAGWVRPRQRPLARVDRAGIRTVRE
jgi:hypothetical protein